MTRQHTYKFTVQWTGNTGKGTSDYKDHERSHTIIVDHLTLHSGATKQNTILKNFCWLPFHRATCYGTSIYVRWMAL